MNRKPAQRDPLDRLLDAAHQAPAEIFDESVPHGFAARVLARRRHPDSQTESIWMLWRRLTTCAAAGATGLALVVAMLPSPTNVSPADEATGWEHQIESWVFEL